MGERNSFFRFSTSLLPPLSSITSCNTFCHRVYTFRKTVLLNLSQDSSHVRASALLSVLFPLCCFSTKDWSDIQIPRSSKLSSGPEALGGWLSRYHLTSKTPRICWCNHWCHGRLHTQQSIVLGNENRWVDFVCILKFETISSHLHCPSPSTMVSPGEPNGTCPSLPFQFQAWLSS